MHNQDTNGQPLDDAAALHAQIIGLTAECAAVIDEAALLHLELALMTAERDTALAAVAQQTAEISVLDEACAVAEEACQREQGLAAMHARQVQRLETALDRRAPVSQSDDDDDDVVLLEQAAQTQTLRRKYQQQSILLADKRIKPSEKVLAAAVWDMARPMGRDPGPAAPTQIYRAALAARTGMSMGTISRKLSDLDSMGVIALDRRRTGPDHTELWAGVGTLPDRSLTAAAAVDALATKRRQERERMQRCPGCGGTHLKARAFVCLDCGGHCTDKEADAAGERIVVTAAGALVDGETGEILTPAPPCTNFVLPLQTSGERDTMATHGEAHDPRTKSAHRNTLLTKRADFVRPLGGPGTALTTHRGRVRPCYTAHDIPSQELLL